MKAKEIRARFLEFFAERGHTIVKSSSLVPENDPTLIFSNAGMNQFKAVFLGKEKRDYVRAASCQKCMRVSGKHNDLEEVGRDARHHTFFEMLGNWSFGDYYKRESLQWGWEFLTREMGLPADRLWASVYKDDDESFAIWRDDIGLPEARIRRLGDIEKGDEENFWSMGDTGPCGPCSEIYIDQGAEMACNHPDGCALGVCDCDRWLELWNHVFMEFDRDESGALTPLPMKSVDTGLGLERLVAVVQQVKSNYESDLFTPLTRFVAEISGKAPKGEDKVSMQVIADHARAVCMAITDGAVPANDGRGYVVRRILRRAARHGSLLELKEPFLWRVSEKVIAEMGEAYPELLERQDRVLETIRREEERFIQTLDRGLAVYAEYVAAMRAEKRRTLNGEEIFKLHDTFGFPVDLTAVIAEADGLDVDQEGFRALMEQQRAASKTQRSFMGDVGDWLPVADGVDPALSRGAFTGYTNMTESTRVVGVRGAGEWMSQILLETSPFYAESGGQVGDRGVIRLHDGTQLDVMTTVGDESGPLCVVTGEADELAARFRLHPDVNVSVADERFQTMRHHTATHLLHAALRQVLGDHVAQAGSEVGPDKLRFDFHHDRAVSDLQIVDIERIVNAAIMSNVEVKVHEGVPLAEARARGAMALFGEKYGDRVRMIEIPGAYGEFSLELCGGTHVGRTGDIGPFRITAEGSSAAGVRRIEARAGEAALAMMSEDRAIIQELGGLLRCDADLFIDQVEALIQEKEDLNRELRTRKQDKAAGSLADLVAGAVALGDYKVLTARVQAEDRDALMALGDRARDMLGTGAVVLAAEWDGKATLLVTVTDDLVSSGRLHAGNIVKSLAATVGGRGGGRPNTAQAGLPGPEKIDQTLAAAVNVIESEEKAI